MKIGYFQFSPHFHSPASTREYLRSELSSCSGDLLVLPELAISGYLFGNREEAESCSETVPGPTSELFTRLSAETGTSFVYGFLERSAEGQLFNSAAVVTPEGILQVYRKTHLFNREKMVFSESSNPYKPVTVNGVRIGILICFDHMFPEAARTLALAGAQVICHPANLVLEGYAQLTSRVRSMENRLFWVLANRTGSESSGEVSCSYTGCSQITSPTGDILCSSNRTGQAVNWVDINPEEALDKNITKRNNIFTDRRKDLYQLG